MIGRRTRMNLAHNGDLEYRVIQKAEIPPQPPKSNRRYGQWLALARTMRLLPVDQAIELELSADLYPSKAIVSIHGAAREVGIKVSSMYCGGKLYLMRSGWSEEQPRYGQAKHAVLCPGCGEKFMTTRGWQRWCSKEACQEQRKREKRRNYKRRIRAQKAVDKIAA